MKIAPNCFPAAEVATCSRLEAMATVVAAGVDTSTTWALWHDRNRPIRRVT